MNIAIIMARINDIMSAILSHPLIYLPLIGSWVITNLFFIINRDEKHGHTYVMSTGIALIFTAYVISPFAVHDLTWSLSDMRVFIILVLFTYGVALSVLGIMRTFPDVLAEFFGDPGHALAPSIMAVLYIENKIPFDWLTFFIILVPILIVTTIKLTRRVGR